MCGIVGYIGKQQATPILIEGLKRLEYRGYDSAGVAVLNDASIQVLKRPGKIHELEKEILSAQLHGTVGIGHTRWATHGEPNEINAHPHWDCNRRIALIHNGIIENFMPLKRELEKNGHVFRSETDTEVLAHLIETFYDGDLEKAVRYALAEVQGTYGILVVSSEEPDVVIAARNGSPLLIGIGSDEYFAASDAAAVIGHTRDVIYLDDGEMAILKPNTFFTKTVHDQPVEKHVERISFDLEQIEKAGFPHFMLKEIFEQPETLRTTMRGRVLPEEGNIRLGGLQDHMDQLLKAKRMVFTACGTSWHAALIGEYIFEDMLRIPVEVDYASEFRYRHPVLDPETIVMVISQSGETADTLAAVREVKKLRYPVFGICNVVGSTIARETVAGVYLHVGPEIGVASTKAFTAQVAVLTMISMMLARRKWMSAEEGRKIIRELQAIPDKIQRILDQNDEIKKLAEMYQGSRNFLYLGRGYNFPVALEGALKLKEISYIHAEGYPAAEMKHGPIALIDENMPVVFIAIKDSTYDKIISNIEEVKARKGRVIAVATEGDDKIVEKVDHVIYVPPTLDFLSPLLTIVPLQLLAYHIAILRGCNVDQPRNLAKSVTVE
ncbi:MAG TPA: glutamine--fructose-6-phosphate transaminase (isomerizing) [Bacteroidetes bacterium]|nr:glutamine--fructose-6-phosphate transaminase (isomerizing) [Bacteroidota bacterium]